MDYPKYKREEKGNAKLSQIDVDDIVFMKKNGERAVDIAKQYNISKSYVWILCMPEEKRLRREKIKSAWFKNKIELDLEYREKVKEWDKKRRQKKLDIFGDEIRKWHVQAVIKSQKKKPEETNRRKREWAKKNRKQKK